MSQRDDKHLGIRFPKIDENEPPSRKPPLKKTRTKKSTAPRQASRNVPPDGTGGAEELSFPEIIERRRSYSVDLLIAYSGGIGSAITYDSWPTIWLTITSWTTAIGELGNAWTPNPCPLF